MRELPAPKFKIEERDGQLVVIEEKQRKRPRLRLPRPKLPALRFEEWGIALFRRRHFPDYNDVGDAFVLASALDIIETIDARSDDWFWLTPRQQAVLGWASYWPLASGISLVAVFLMIERSSLLGFLFVAISIMAFMVFLHTWWTPFTEQIQLQRLETDGADVLP